MKSLWFLIVTAVLGRELLAQSSNDYWDLQFHPKKVEQRKAQRYQEWLDSWKDRPCTAGDVKQYWLMSLTEPEPDRLNSEYMRVIKKNDWLKAALRGNDFDFEAQDIADQVNVMRFRDKGQNLEAESLERTRLERLRLHKQQQFQREMIARQNEFEQRLASEIQRLRFEVEQAIDDAEVARRRNTHYHY